MTAVVLCDGSEGSLRCVEVACAATAHASLILLHVRNTHTTSTVTQGDDTAASGITAVPPQASTERAAAAAAGGSAAHDTSIPCGDVLTATLKAVHTNKYIKGRVRYAMETISADAASTKPYVGSVAGTTTNTADAARTSIVAAAENTSADTQAVGTVVRHVACRAAHHRAAAILLGVGQRQEGKVWRVGAVAQDTLHHLRGTYPLFFIKKDGVKWRPLPSATTTTTATATAASLTFTIVVPLPPVQVTPAQEDKAEEAVVDVSTPSPAVKAVVEAALAYAQQHCARPSVPSVDSVAFLLIAPSSHLTDDLEAGNNAAAAESAVAESSAVSPVEAYKQYLESLLPSVVVATPSVSAAAPEQATTATAAGVVEGEEEKEKTGEVVGEGTAPPAATRVTVCTLKASKKHPRVTLADGDVALPQVMKQVSAMKPDVLLLPVSIVPENLQMAMLSAGKPHCVTLPC